MGLVILPSIGSAACYVLATLAMKRWDAIGTLWAIALITGALAAAVLLETEALRQARLSYVLIMILGFEASLAVLSGWLLLGERYAVNEFAGFALVVFGVAVAHMTPTVTNTP